MSIIYNAAPQAIIHGFKDESGRPPVYDPVPIPTHLPILPLFTQKGDPSEPYLVSGDAIGQMYGRETFNTRGKYYMHQHVYADVFRSRQSVMIQRLTPPDVGPKARLLLSLEIVDENLPQYARNPDGSWQLDSVGNRIPTGSTVPGHIARWVLNDWMLGMVEQDFGTMAVKGGTLTNSTGASSQIYPIMELRASSVGEWGNRLGLRFSAPTLLSVGGTDVDLIDDLNAFLYRFQFVEKITDTSTPMTIEGLLGEQSVDLVFPPGLVNNKAGGLQVSVDEMLVESYRSISDPSIPKRLGPWDAVHVYHANLENVLVMIGSLEAPYGYLPTLTMSAGSEYTHLINPFTAKHVGGEPYETLEILGPSGGGIHLSESTTLYAAGASDGTITEASFDKAVREWFQNWDNLFQLEDWARYPFSAVWDSGFTLETKETMLISLGKRKDMFVVLCTQDVSQPQNSIAVDSSLAIALKAAANAYPESVLHGTPVSRAAIVGQSGYLVNSQYKKIMPLSLEMAARVANMMGAGSGRWNSNLAFDVSPNNIVTMFRDVNNPFKPASVRKKDWDNGLIWAQSYDTRSLFFPAFQTVYDDDTSVLNSFITMACAVEGIKACYRSWRDITGRADLTRDQLRERLTAMLEADLEPSRFGNRFVIQPEVFFTGKDEQRGYSYSVNLNIYAPNMFTVGSYTVVLRRLDDLEQ